jgi:hypothetical protein
VSPRWRADGKELYYLAPDNKLMAATTGATGARFVSERPQALFQTHPVQGSFRPPYDVAGDGRFLIDTDEMAVPTKYKRVTVTLPAETWELLCDSLDLDLREQVVAEVRAPKVEVSTSLVKADLKAEIAVPGAILAGGTYLVRK